MARTSRLPWIDLVRMIALFCVILCHSVEGIYSLNIDFMLSVSNRTRVFAITGFTVGRLGVPLFLLITGYLMLDREYDTRSTVMFWKRSWLHLLICTVVWFLLYDIFLCIVNAKSPDLITIAENLLFLRTVNMSHVWYMPMMSRRNTACFGSWRRKKRRTIPLGLKIQDGNVYLSIQCMMSKK